MDSLYIYVMHGFVMKGLIAAGLTIYIDSEWKELILILLSLVLLPVLGSKFSKLIADSMMNPFGMANSILVNRATRN